MRIGCPPCAAVLLLVTLVAAGEAAAADSFTVRLRLAGIVGLATEGSPARTTVLIGDYSQPEGSWSSGHQHPHLAVLRVRDENWLAGGPPGTIERSCHFGGAWLSFPLEGYELGLVGGPRDGVLIDRTPSTDPRPCRPGTAHCSSSRPMYQQTASATWVANLPDLLSHVPVSADRKSVRRDLLDASCSGCEGRLAGRLTILGGRLATSALWRVEDQIQLVTFQDGPPERQARALAQQLELTFEAHSPIEIQFSRFADGLELPPLVVAGDGGSIVDIVIENAPSDCLADQAEHFLLHYSLLQDPVLPLAPRPAVGGGGDAQCSPAEYLP